MVTDDKWLNMILAKLTSVEDKIDSLSGAVASQDAAARDRQRQLDSLKVCTEKLVETVAQHTIFQAQTTTAILATNKLVDMVAEHTKSIDRHEQWLRVLQWGVVAVATPVLAYIVRMIIMAIEHGVRVP